MSFFSRIFPFLFDDVTAPSSVVTPAEIDALPVETKTELAQNASTSLPVLAHLARDDNPDIRLVLAQRMHDLVQKTPHDNSATAALLLETLKQLAEESITPVRIALASALKDVANCPPDIARKLADDAERAVAEPIIRYSLSLSDEDLLDLVTRHPQDWHTETIAQRKTVSEPVSRALLHSGNKKAGIILLDNDGARISDDDMHIIEHEEDYRDALQRRASLVRKIKRDVFIMTEERLHQFLRQSARLDKRTTARVLETVQRRITIQDNTPSDPAAMSEEQLKDALSVGKDDLVLQALAAKANTSIDTVKRMIIDSGAAKPVIALCVKAGLSMTFSVLLQQRLTRLSPTKIIYPKNGSQNPLTDEEIMWQWEFFTL